LLLLVLILVLIAFGLLVVALLSGSVLWAWVSVGVSVAAAAVLLVDWLQRRSAVRAGADAGRAAPLPMAAAVPPPHVPGREPVVEPATEVLPVVRPDASYPGSSPADADMAIADGLDERPGPQETVVLRAVAPPGSTKRPSGAPDGTASPDANSSQSVTNAGEDADRGERPDGSSIAPRQGETGDTADADAEATVKVAAANRGEPSGTPTGSGAAPHAAGPGAPAADLPPLGPDGAPPEEPHDADAAGVVAELDDEVLVVDEMPRYHQAGCRSLANTPVIPLPAREAVELGFTPCAWCTPNRALSSRHHAGAR
jgi:hypothetical protein